MIISLQSIQTCERYICFVINLYSYIYAYIRQATKTEKNGLVFFSRNRRNYKTIEEIKEIGKYNKRDQ